MASKAAHCLLVAQGSPSAIGLVSHVVPSGDKMCSTSHSQVAFGDDTIMSDTYDLSAMQINLTLDVKESEMGLQVRPSPTHSVKWMHGEFKVA